MPDDLDIALGGERGRTTLLRVKGRLDGKTAPALISNCEQVRRGGQNLVLNLAGVSFVASSGIGALLSLAEQYRNAGTHLGLAAVSPAVESVVALLNLDQFLSIFHSEDEALTAMEG